MVKHLPNFTTLLNLTSGMVGLLFVIKGDNHTAVFFVLLSGVFDFLDGFFARLLKAYSKLGESLDSLADIVSFGVLPSILAFTALTGNLQNHGCNFLIPYVSLLIPVFSAIRLAIFNTEGDQKMSFKGLPTPANAFLVSAAVFMLQDNTNIIPLNSWILVFVIISGCILMVSRVRMFSFKSLKSGSKLKLLPFLFIIGSVLLIAIFSIEGIFISILLYVIISVVSRP